MKIGILGAGQMGKTLARLVLRAGHEVWLANSRGPETLRPLLDELGAGAHAVTAREVVAAADVVILATRWEQTPVAVKHLGPWVGKIVVDTTNNRIGPRPEDLIDLDGRTSSEVVADLLPGARVVKAFNHQPIQSLSELPNYANGERKALFIAGDDAEAKLLVEQFIRDIGGEPIDTGGLRSGGRLQGTGGPLAGYGRLLAASEAQSLLRQLQIDGAANTI